MSLPTYTDHQKNDVRYVIDHTPTSPRWTTSRAVRRPNELINRLRKAKDELFEEDGTLTVLSL